MIRIYKRLLAPSVFNPERRSTQKVWRKSCITYARPEAFTDPQNRIQLVCGRAVFLLALTKQGLAMKQQAKSAESMPDPFERKILSAFDRPGTGALSLAELGDSAAIGGVVKQLVEREWLRGAAKPDAYERTEDGRLQLAAPRDVTIYSRPGCHLCIEAKFRIAPLLVEFGARLTEINIDEDPELRARYDHDVPVIFLGAQKVAKHRVDPAQFRRQLRDAGL
jgi:glutaredoxin